MSLPHDAREVVCDGCGITFITAWTEAEAVAERDALWGPEVAAGEPMMVICDTCFQEFMAWLKANEATIRGVENADTRDPR